MKHSRQKLVVVGNGMVGFRFCRELHERAPNAYSVTVFGDEERPAYDRIHLTRLLCGDRIDDLLLAPSAWYQTRRIELRLADPVVAIDRRQRTVRSRSGAEATYDTLVLATGADPVVPSIPGTDLPGVFIYRAAADLAAIRLHCRRSSSAAVLGGGLLGLEVAAALAGQGIETFVIESGPHLLPRQLDPLSADIVHEQMEHKGVRIAVKRRVEAIRHEIGELVVELDDSPPLEVDLVVVAAGVRPRDLVARAAGLDTDDLRGGVAIDDHLTTSDPRILAIGDCARHAGIAYGLVGPGYHMARVAADRLAGGTSRFAVADRSARLNVAGIDVAVLGDYSGGGRSLVYQDGHVRRTLVLRDGCIVGVRAVGLWSELLAIERAMADQRRLVASEIDRFCRTGDPWPEEPEVTVVMTADRTMACPCAQVSFGAVRAEVARGCRSLAVLGATTGAGTVCGSCRPVLARLCDDHTAGRPRARRPLLVASLAALAAVAAFIGVTPIPLEANGRGAGLVDWLSQFWRDSSGKKLSGFVLVGFTALGLVLSARKRIVSLRRTSLPLFRVVHAAVGALAMALLVAHTGMHMGSNLNRALLFTFLGVVASGALVGVAVTASNRGSPTAAIAARQARTWLMRGHWMFLWVFPVLLAFHVIAVYYF